MSFPVLHTERLTLRAPGPEDVPGMLAFLASPRSRFYGGPMEAGPAWRRFATFAGDWLLRGYGMFSLTRRDTGAPIGLAGPFHPADFAEPELAWLLTDAAHEGQGFAREGCLAVLRHLFTDLGWPSVISYIDPANTASTALAKRLGARLEPEAPIPAVLQGSTAFRHFPGADTP